MTEPYNPSGKFLPEIVENLEGKLITDALEKSNGKQCKAASILSIRERNLRYKLKKYGLKN